MAGSHGPGDEDMNTKFAGAYLAVLLLAMPVATAPARLAASSDPGLVERGFVDATGAAMVLRHRDHPAAARTAAERGSVPASRPTRS